MKHEFSYQENRQESTISTTMQEIFVQPRIHIIKASCTENKQIRMSQ